MEEVSAGAPLQVARRSVRLLRLASDERLVTLVRAGDERAFEVLYDRHHRPILGFCRHMLGTREEAEDAVQQTFLSAYRDLVGSTKAIQPRPWLFAIARNRCLSVLRARREHVTLDVAEPSTEGLAATVERREDVRELLADLSRLPEEQRAALLLAELGALDHEGIATVLGCRREQVKALVFQARSSLAADRQARATPCEDVRAQLATATGALLRRGPLRRHLTVCDGCRAFKAEVTRQRKLLAIALPVVPTALLKAGALPATAAAASAATTAGGAAAGTAAGAAAVTVGASGAGGGAAAGGLLAAGAATVTKVALAVTVAGAVAGGGALTVATLGDDGSRMSHSAPTPQTSPRSAPAPSQALVGVPALGSATRSPSSRASKPAPPAQAPGFTPRTSPGAGGNGTAARSFAQDRAHARGRAPVHPTDVPRGRGAQPHVDPRTGPRATEHRAIGRSKPKHAKPDGAAAPPSTANPPVATPPTHDEAPAEKAQPGKAPHGGGKQGTDPAALAPAVPPSGN